VPDDIEDAGDDRTEEGCGDDALSGAAPQTPAIPADRAVLDRVVDGVTAVLLVGPEERPLELPASALPEGVVDGTWLRLDLATDPPTVLGIDAPLTEQRAQDLEGRLRDLRRSRGGGRFD
jgi:hypothetical protein